MPKLRDEYRTLTYKVNTLENKLSRLTTLSEFLTHTIFRQNIWSVIQTIQQNKLREMKTSLNNGKICNLLISRNQKIGEISYLMFPQSLDWELDEQFLYSSTLSHIQFSLHSTSNQNILSYWAILVEKDNRLFDTEVGSHKMTYKINK